LILIFTNKFSFSLLKKNYWEEVPCETHVEVEVENALNKKKAATTGYVVAFWEGLWALCGLFRRYLNFALRDHWSQKCARKQKQGPLQPRDVSPTDDVKPTDAALPRVVRATEEQSHSGGVIQESAI